jgi:hypothetical protein
MFEGSVITERVDGRCLLGFLPALELRFIFQGADVVEVSARDRIAVKRSRLVA